MQEANDDAVLGVEFLTDDIGIAAMAEKPFAQPCVQAVQRRATVRLPIRNRSAFPQITPNCIARAAKLPRKPLRSPSHLVQPNQRCNLVRFKHAPILRSDRAVRIGCLQQNLQTDLLFSQGVNSWSRQGVSFSGRLTDAALQIARISPTILVRSRRRPKHVQRPAPSHISRHAPRLPRRSVPDVASCDGRMNSKWVVTTCRGQFKFT
jgi:hypothetical protein